MASRDETLALFQDITNCSDLARSTEILESCEWNLTIAVERYFHQNEAGAESPHTQPSQPQAAPDSGLRRRHAPPPPRAEQNLRQRGDAQEEEMMILDGARVGGQDGSAAASPMAPNAAAVAAVAQPLPAWLGFLPRWNWLQFFLGMAVGLVRKTAALGWGVLAFVGSFFTTLAPSFGSHRLEGAAFVQQFETRCGSAHPVFHMGTFDQAVGAARLSTKLLCVYVESPDTQRASDFARRVLGDQNTIDFFNNNFVLYGAGAHASPSIFFTSRLRLRRLPAFAVVACTTHRRLAIGAVVDPASGEQLVTSLSELMERADPLLAEEMQRRETLRRDQELRVEQDAEYQRALSEHASKHELGQKEQQQKEEKAAAAARAESEAKLHEQVHEQRRLEKQLSVPAPPAEGAPCVRVSFRLHDGGRTDRSFSPDDSVQALHDFVESTYKMRQAFTLLTGHPKQRLAPAATTLAAAGLPTRCLVFVDTNEEE